MSIASSGNENGLGRPNDNAPRGQITTSDGRTVTLREADDAIDSDDEKGGVSLRDAFARIAKHELHCRIESHEKQREINRLQHENKSLRQTNQFLLSVQEALVARVDELSAALERQADAGPTSSPLSPTQSSPDFQTVGYNFANLLAEAKERTKRDLRADLGSEDEAEFQEDHSHVLTEQHTIAQDVPLDAAGDHSANASSDEGSEDAGSVASDITVENVAHQLEAAASEDVIEHPRPERMSVACTLASHLGGINCLSIVRQGSTSLPVTAGDDACIKVWPEAIISMQSSALPVEPLACIRGNRAHVTALCSSAGFIWSGNAAGDVMRWACPPCTIERYAAQGKAINHLVGSGSICPGSTVWSIDSISDQAVAACGDGTVRLLRASLQSGLSPVDVVWQHNRPDHLATSISFGSASAGDPSHAFATWSDSAGEIYDLDSGAVLTSVFGSTSPAPDSLLCSCWGRNSICIAGAASGSCVSVDPRSGVCILSPVSQLPITFVSLHSNERVLSVGDTGGHAHLFDVRMRRVLQTVMNVHGCVFDKGINAGTWAGDSLLCAGADSMLSVLQPII